MSELSLSIEKPGPNPTTGLNPSSEKRPHAARRHYLIDRRRQLRTAFLTSVLAIILLTVVNIAFSMLRSSQSMILSSAAPQLKPVLEAQDTRTNTMLIAFSAVFVAGVFVLTIAETHRTAGAVYAVKKKLDQVRNGEYEVTLRLRPRDSLRDLTKPFNELVTSLRTGALAEADELDRLAQEAASGAGEDSDLAAKLRELAKRKRNLQTC